MEKRKSFRIQVPEEVSGRMMFSADLNLVDLSMSGVRFICHRRIVPGSRVQITIDSAGKPFKLDGSVVRSNLMPPRDGRESYEVAVSFVISDDSERRKLETIIAAVR